MRRLKVASSVVIESPLTAKSSETVRIATAPPSVKVKSVFVPSVILRALPSVMAISGVALLAKAKSPVVPIVNLVEPSVSKESVLVSLVPIVIAAPKELPPLAIQVGQAPDEVQARLPEPSVERTSPDAPSSTGRVKV